MRSLSILGIGLSLVSCFLLLALLAEVYYLLCLKKQQPITPNREIQKEEEAEEEVDKKHFYCWKKPHISLSSKALNPQDLNLREDEGVEAELMRLHALCGPPRFLFTIKEETNDELLELESKTNTPPLTPLNCYNPLFESSMVVKSSSPPPKFKFLRDAEEKLYKRTLREEALKLERFNGDVDQRKFEEGDGSSSSLISIVIGKNHPSPSQVSPLPSHGKLSSFLSSMH